MTGRLVAICTAPAGGEPMVSQQSVRSESGAGLLGDRYATSG